MRHLKTIFSILVAVALAAAPIAVVAQPSRNIQRVYLTFQYDLDSTTAVAGSYSPASPIFTKISTSGSSTTVSAVTATSAPFNLVSVGDLIQFNLTSPGAAGSAVTTTRRVTAKASADSITVDTAVNIPTAGVTFTYLKFTSGANAGWVALGDNAQAFEVYTQLDQLNVGANSIGFKLEGRYTDAANVVSSFNIWPGTNASTAKCESGTFSSGFCNYTTVGTIPPFVSAGLTHPMQVRMLMKINTADDGGDTGVDAESITSILIIIKN